MVSSGPTLLIYLTLHKCYRSCFNSFNKMSTLIIRWTKLIAISKIKEKVDLWIPFPVMVLIIYRMAHLDNSKCKYKNKTTWWCSNKDKWILNKWLECLHFHLHKLWICLHFQLHKLWICLLNKSWCSQIKLWLSHNNMSIKLEKCIMQFKKKIRIIKTKLVK